MIVLLREPATPRQITAMLEEWKVLVKAVVDVRQDVLAAGGEIHVDAVALLLAEGSRREDLWGATWYPENREAHLEALVNVRPRRGNAWVRIDDRDVRARVEGLLRRFLEAGPANTHPLPAHAVTDRKAARERLLREPVSARLAALGEMLTRAASVVPHPIHSETATRLLDEACHLIEWTAAELEPDAAGELVDLQLALTLWLRLWSSARGDALSRALLAHEGACWAERVQVLSTLVAPANPRTGALGKRG